MKYYEYDALNRMLQKTEPDGTQIRNAYNKAGLLEAVIKDGQNFVNNINYNEKAQRTEIFYGNGTKTKYEYDPKNFRLTRLCTTRNSGADILQDLNYVYDPQGNITEIVDNAQQTHYFNNSVIEPRNLYEYDALYRLTKASGREHIGNTAPGNNDFVNNIPLPNDGNALRNYTLTYQYDELGNILEQKNTGNWTRTYNYDFPNNNYLHSTKVGSITANYTYDAHGNMTSMPHLPEMKYDYADQLNEVKLDASNNKAYYIYDAEGNRVRKVIVKGNIIEERFYIGDYEVYRKTTNGTFNIERKTLNIMDNKQKIAQIDSSSTNITIRYQLSNHLGSAALELDENAEIISYEEYYPFGSTSYKSGRSESEVSQKRYKYVMKELDNETGLYYYGARYYASWLGRFVSVDPMADEFAWVNPYNYAENSPIANIDLWGLQAWSVHNNAEEVMSQEDWSQYVVNEINNLLDSNKVFDCADLGLYLLAKYYKDKGVELTFEHPLTGEVLSSNDEYWGNYEEIGKEAAFNNFLWGSQKTFKDYYNRENNRGLKNKHFLGAFNASSIMSLGFDVKEAKIGDIWSSLSHVRVAVPNAGFSQSSKFTSEPDYYNFDQSDERQMSVATSMPYRELWRNTDTMDHLIRFNFLREMPSKRVSFGTIPPIKPIILKVE